jgi:signal transduction histidine kinase
VRHKLKNHGIKFVLQLAPELPEVLADAAQLNQALLNLVLNAVEAMPHGGTLTIQTGRGAEKQLFIELKDTGTGMTAEQQAGAFRSLLQTTKKRGTGIGLAIVSKIIEAHHGTISVSSAPNSGTAFRILIPHQ